MNHAPIFKPIFGQQWAELPEVMHKHYANRPYSDDVISVEGRLDLMCAGPIKWFAPLFWLLGTVPPQNEKNVRVTVDFESSPLDNSFTFNRVFYFKDRKPYRFQSTMMPTKDNELVEIMKFGIGWKTAYVWQDNKVTLLHKGYVLKYGSYFIPLPISWLLGSGNATEFAIDENSFEMSVDITQPWLGKIYQYTGRFNVINIKQSELKV